MSNAEMSFVHQDALAGVTPYDARTSLGDVLTARLNDFSGLLGALGLEGQFIPTNDVEEINVTNPSALEQPDSDGWSGVYVEDDVAAPMDITVYAPGRLATAVAARMEHTARSGGWRGAIASRFRSEPPYHIDARIMWREAESLNPSQRADVGQ